MWEVGILSKDTEIPTFLVRSAWTREERARISKKDLCKEKARKSQRVRKGSSGVARSEDHRYENFSLGKHLQCQALIVSVNHSLRAIMNTRKSEWILCPHDFWDGRTSFWNYASKASFWLDCALKISENGILLLRIHVCAVLTLFFEQERQVLFGWYRLIHTRPFQTCELFANPRDPQSPAIN